MEGAGKVVELGTAVVFIGRGYEAGHAHQQEQQELQGQGGPQDSLQEPSAPG